MNYFDIFVTKPLFRLFLHFSFKKSKKNGITILFEMILFLRTLDPSSLSGAFPHRETDKHGSGNPL